MTQAIRIGELAHRAGTSPDTLRFYERIGLRVLPHAAVPPARAASRTLDVEDAHEPGSRGQEVTLEGWVPERPRGAEGPLPLEARALSKGTAR